MKIQSKSRVNTGSDSAKIFEVNKIGDTSNNSITGNAPALNLLSSKKLYNLTKIHPTVDITIVQ